MTPGDRSGGLRLLAALLALAAFSCSQPQNQPRIGERFPRIELRDLNGASVTIPDDFRGKVVIVRFWEDCCSYNIDEMSSVDRMFDTCASKGVAVVTVCMGKSRKAAEREVAMLEIRYPVLIDSGSESAQRCGVSKVPSTFILDRSGIVRVKRIGVGKRDYEKLVASLL